MPFDDSFQREAGGVPNIAPLGSDPDPSTLSGPDAAAYAERDNAFQFNLQQAGPQPLHLALAGTYDGGGEPGLATVAVYLYDPEQTKTWLLVPGGGVSFALGSVVQVDLPVVMSAINAGYTLALVFSVASAADGVYTFTCGLSESDGDTPLSMVESRTLTGAGAAVQASELTGPGWLTLYNLDQTQSVYLGTSDAVGTTNAALGPGLGRSVYYANLQSIWLYIPNGVQVSEIVER